MEKQKNRDFMAYYGQFKNKIYNYFWYRVGFDKNLAEDLTSEVFLKALEKFARYDAEKPFQAWIYAISHNHLLNYYRTIGREVNLLVAENIGKHEMKKVEDKLELERVFGSINELPQYHREVLLLRFSDELTNGEIAEVLNKDEGAIRTQISRAMAELRNNL